MYVTDRIPGNEGMVSELFLWVCWGRVGLHINKFRGSEVWCEILMSDYFRTDKISQNRGGGIPGDQAPLSWRGNKGWKQESTCKSCQCRRIHVPLVALSYPSVRLTASTLEGDSELSVCQDQRLQNYIQP